jgi:hypothetical protein
MAIVVAALDAWASSGPADLAPPADIIGRYTHLILAEVFQLVEGRIFDRNYYINDGPRAKLLCADIGFWRVHARHRGLDVAMTSALRNYLALSRLKSSSNTTRDYSAEMAELGAFLIRLLRSNDLNMRPSWGYSFGVSNATVYEVAELVKGVGVKIKTCQNPPSIKDSVRID